MEHPEQDEMVHGALNALSRAGDHVEELRRIARDDETPDHQVTEKEMVDEAIKHAGGALLAIGQAIVYTLIDIAQNTRRQ